MGVVLAYSSNDIKVTKKIKTSTGYLTGCILRGKIISKQHLMCCSQGYKSI